MTSAGHTTTAGTPTGAATSTTTSTAGTPTGAATSTTTIPAGTATSAAVIPITVPRIGGVITEPNGDQIAWVGGPERVRLAGHKSVDCLRPRGYKYQKQVQDTCEKGLPEVQRIEIGSNGQIAGQVTLSIWANSLKDYVEKVGLDTQFYVEQDGVEHYLFNSWGRIQKKSVADREVFLASGDEYDRQGLTFARTAVFNSIGPNLQHRLLSKPAQTSGIGLTFTILSMLSSGSASVARTLVNKLQKLKLEEQPQEDVEAFCAIITELCRRIEASGHIPEDLALIVAGLFLSTSVSLFRSHAERLYNTLDENPASSTWEDILVVHSNKYTTLLANDKWPPTNVNPAADALSAMTARIAKLEKVTTPTSSTVICHHCKQPGHIRPNCPQLKPAVTPTAPRAPASSTWRRVPPADGEPHVKTLPDGRVVEWCAICRLWSQNAGRHGTATHRSKSASSPATSPATAPPATTSTTPASTPASTPAAVASTATPTPPPAAPPLRPAIRSIGFAGLSSVPHLRVGNALGFVGCVSDSPEGQHSTCHPCTVQDVHDTGKGQEFPEDVDEWLLGELDKPDSFTPSFMMASPTTPIYSSTGQAQDEVFEDPHEWIPVECNHPKGCGGWY